MATKTLDDIDWERPAPSSQQPTRTLDQVFAAKPDASQGLTDISPSLGGVRGMLQVGIPMAATALTAPFTSGMSIPAIYGTEALASVGAEGLLQALGVSEPSLGQLGTAAIAPGAGRAAFTGLAQVPRLLPGFGKAAQAALTPFARQIPQDMLGGGPSAKELYSLVERAGNVKEVLPQFPHLATTIKELGTDIDKIPWDKLKADLRATGLEDLFEDIAISLRGAPARVEKVAPHTVTSQGAKVPISGTGLPIQRAVTGPPKAPGLTFEEATAAIEGFGRIISRTSDDALRGNYKQLYKALLDDLETMPQPIGTPLEVWNQARTAYKREKARTLLSDAVESATSTKDGVDLINPDRVVKWLRTHKADFIGEKGLGGRISKEEFYNIETQFRNMAKLEGHNMSKFIGLLAGGALSGGAGGALTGYIAAEQLSNLLMKDSGRAIVGRMIMNPNASKFRKLGATLGASIAGAFDQPGSLPLGD